jgi:1-hydroxycarotenoid 3,4-desaturase
MRPPKVIVVGAGVGGLSAAMELAREGFDVCVLEAQADVGGKIRQLPVGEGLAVDSGPTVFTMRWVFDELFEHCDTSLEDRIALKPLNLLARHRWDGGKQLDLFADEDESVDAISRFANPAEGLRYREFCKTARRTFETLDRTFMRGSQPNVLQLVARIARDNPAGLTAIHPFRTLWQELGRHFSDQRLRQLFGRYATYCGGSPFASPGTLMLIAHAEKQGVWLIEGGMTQLVTAMADVAKGLGAQIRCQARVERIVAHNGRACAVQLESGEEIACDAIVFNGDASALGTGLLGHKVARSVRPVPPHRRSQSAVTLSCAAETDGVDLAPHTVFFGPHYEAEFDDVFRDRRVPSQPTVYVHAPDRPVDAGAPRRDEERLFILINAPADGDQHTYSEEELRTCERKARATMTSCGLSLRLSPERMQWTTPTDFARLFPGTGGALYGLAPHGWRSSFRRLGSSSGLANLYLAGGSVHPGPGIPMAALSGRLAAASVIRKYRSIVQLVPAATIGGTSMA